MPKCTQKWQQNFFFRLWMASCIYFTFDGPMRTNCQKHCSLWLCHAIGVVIHGLTDKSETVVEFDSDRCFLETMFSQNICFQWYHIHKIHTKSPYHRTPVQHCYPVRYLDRYSLCKSLGTKWP